MLLLLMGRYKALGIRLDSGDLAYLSKEVRNFFSTVERELKVPGFGKMVVTASNDLNEETIDALNKQVIIHSFPNLTLKCSMRLIFTKHMCVFSSP